MPLFSRCFFQARGRMHVCQIPMGSIHGCYRYCYATGRPGSWQKRERGSILAGSKAQCSFLLSPRNSLPVDVHALPRCRLETLRLCHPLRHDTNFDTSPCHGPKLSLSLTFESIGMSDGIEARSSCSTSLPATAVPFPRDRSVGRHHLIGLYMGLISESC